MSTMKDYSDQEWKAISGAPTAAGLFITLADASGPIGIAKEAMAVSRAISEAATGSDTPDVVKSLAEGMTSGARPELPDLPMGDRNKTKEALIGTIKAAVSAIETKSPAEAKPFKMWLTSIAAKVSQASKEGGFLGIGGTQVSGDEENALRQLSEVLGLA